MLGEAGIVIGGKQSSVPFKGLGIGLFILIVHISPVALDVAIEGLLHELGKVGVLTGQVIHSPAGNNLAGGEDGIDYE